MADLNDAQSTAVLHASGPLLVFAGAGSGKTRVITYRVANLLAHHSVPPYRILAVTFTNKAAGEMRERLTQLAGESLAHELWVGTFHATCARLLRRYHDEVGLSRQFVIYDDSDQRAVMTRVVRDAGLDERAYPPKLILSRVHRFKREAVAPNEVDATQNFDETAIELYQGYEKALRTANAVDFEDLILHIMRIAENTTSFAGRELRERFEHVLVDEFQDTNATQYRLVRALAARTQNLCVVGDDDQSIYSWRGADVRNIRGFRHDFPSAQVVKLEQNYRSSGNIVQAALSIIEQSAQREPKQLFTKEAAGDKVRVIAIRDEREEAARVVLQLRQELTSGVPANQLAVFYRVNAQSRVLEEALRGENVNYQVIGGVKFFDRAEVKNLLAYLRLIDNPRSDADLMRIINVPTRGIGNKTVNRLLSTAARRDTSAFDAIDATLNLPDVKTAARKKLGAFRDLIEELRRDAQTMAPHQLAEEVLDRTGYRAQLKQDDTAESDARLENLQELIGSMLEYEGEVEQTGEEANLAGYLERVSLVADIDAARDEPAVLLMTVHSAKGLEFDSVLLTGMEEEMFPYRGLDGESPEELEEERRLAYVAVTRARKRLTIYHAGVRTIFGSARYLAPSRFLADLPTEIVEKSGASFGRSAGGTWQRGGEPAWAGRRSSFSRAYSSTADSDPVSGRTIDYDTADYETDDEDSSAPQAVGGRQVDYSAFDDEGSGASRLRAGARVVHRRFGRGVVESVEPGQSPSVVARFPGFGKRKIKAEFLRLG